MCYEAVSAYLNNKLTQDPQDYRAYVLRGVLYLHMGDYDQALKDFNKSIIINSQYPLGFINRGLVFLLEDDLRGALFNFTHAISFQSESLPAIYNGRALVYKKRENFEKAFTEFDKAISLDPLLPGVYKNKANVFYEFKYYLKAIDECKKALEADPDFYLAQVMMAYSYLNLNQKDKALESFFTAQQMDPDDWHMCYNIAKLYKAQGIWHKALISSRFRSERGQ